MATPATVADFEALLLASKRQQEPQRLLFVFVRRQLDEHATSAQHAIFVRSDSGHLQPCLCVDKASDDIASFTGRRVRPHRPTLGHRDCQKPRKPRRHRSNSDEAGQPLRFMINAINAGRVGEFAAFNREGRTLRFL